MSDLNTEDDLDYTDKKFEEDDGDTPEGTAGHYIPEYEKEMSGAQLESYIGDIADTVRIGLDQSISILTPWFFNNMPKIYYQTTPRQEKIRHLSAIITGHIFETKQTVELWDRDKSKVTYIGPGGSSAILLDMANRIASHPVKMGAVYFSRDNLLFLSTFFCTEHTEKDEVNKRIIDKVEHARNLMRQTYKGKELEIERYLANLDNDFIMYATAARLTITFRMVNHMLNRQGAYTFLDILENSAAARLTLGIKNISPSQILEPVLQLFDSFQFNVGRAFIVRLTKGYDQTITVMHFILNHASGKKITEDFVPKIRLTKALRTLGWVDQDLYSGLTRAPYDFSINAANLVRSMSVWCHIFLSKINPYAYSAYRVRNCLINNYQLTNKVVALFRLKFDPMRHEDRKKGDYEQQTKELEEEITKLIEDIDREIFKECAKFVRHCLKTNYFMNTKTGHAFRFAGEVLNSKHYTDKPYGFYFITGKDFRFFHVRWKDISRGGMRVVMPRNEADYDYALAGLFDEVYGLSHAQQLKNKDIPEGGSKAVLVLRPGGHRDQAVKASVNALIDILVEYDEAHEETKNKMVTYYTKPEIIYLGPDENITNELISWIPEQASRRGYKYANAFMSSKPGDGINHKEYGVTSEGVNVFVENTLHFLEIDPKNQKFSVKMTGGPDGDVAGNELKILHREYGENPRILAIADGLGCAFDPDGLDWAELLKLVDESQSIVHFDTQKLTGKDAFVTAADNNETIRIRNEITAKTYADIFIPAGGRPYTVNGKNWELFLDEDQKPSMKAVVEGANIYFTSKARDKLQEAGVKMVKDSTANKTGVICSSYEIIASLVFAPEEFLEFKEKYVNEVLDILRAKADAEAKLLFHAFTLEEGQKTLVDLSLSISREINKITDILLEQWANEEEKLIKDSFFQEIVLKHCPPMLRKEYQERIKEALPATHQIAIVASSIASFVVYREGLGWLKNIPRKHWAPALQIYMDKIRLTDQLVKSIGETNIDDKEQINAILSKSAARDLTILELQEKLLLK